MASGCVRVDSTPQKNQKKISGASGLAFLSVTSGLVFVTFFYFGWYCKRRKTIVVLVTQRPRNRSLFCSTKPTSSRTGALKFDHCFSSGSVGDVTLASSAKTGGCPKQEPLFRRVSWWTSEFLGRQVMQHRSRNGVSAIATSVIVVSLL